MSSLSDVLKRAKDDHESATSTRVVLGNESCDLDSVACTLAMAHLYSVVNPPSVMPLPLLNCQREDFPLRTDIVSLLEELMISPDDLLFFPEVDLKNLPDPSITLVDHNTPPMDYTSLVDEIIDHHQDSESVVTCSRTIELVGSCSTLVAQKLLNRDDYTMTQDVATLLLAAILIDTGDLKAEGRCTHWDVDVSSQLKPLCHIQDLYNRVLSARENLNALTGLQILRKDFKKSSVDEIQVGFSSACILITELAATRLSLPNDMEVFANQEGLHLLVLLGIDMKPLRRQIALYQPPNLPPGISHDLTDSIAANLELDTSVNVERIGEGTFDGIIMEQGNTSLSRKQLMPMIINCLASGNVEQLPEDHNIVKIIEENNHLRPEMEETPSHQGSLLQLESISVRLGESLDSLALAQDSDDEHRPSSLSNMYSLTSVDDQMQPSHPLEPEPPLEPEIVMLSPPAVLPEEIESSVSSIPEYSSREEHEDQRTFRYVSIDGEERRISLKLIEPYRNIVQHGGYTGNERTAVIVISAFYLPPKSLLNYQQVIPQLFFYILSILDKLVVDDYVIVYLHSGAPRNSIPGIQWFHRFYKMVDRRLRKNLKQLYLVHPTFWVKTVLRLVRPFISRKFYRKVHFLESLRDLERHVHLDAMMIPEAVRRTDELLNSSHYAAKETKQ